MTAALIYAVGVRVLVCLLLPVVLAVLLLAYAFGLLPEVTR